MIDYEKISNSIKFFEKEKFKRIESPWTVTKEISQITAPKDATLWSIEEKKKVLVASGEQSFLYLYLKGFLPKGRFQTVTPCFRDEPFDKTHTKYFIKNELIDTENVNYDNLTEITFSACRFFEQYTDAKNVKLVDTEDGYDITVNGIEVGSYGIRSCEYLEWVYATACAEPRLTYALQAEKENKKK